jgi:hypothetical protein
LANETIVSNRSCAILISIRLAVGGLLIALSVGPESCYSLR